MNLTKEFKDGPKGVKNLSLNRYDNNVTFSSGYSGRGFKYTFTLSPKLYVETANKITKQLALISGMDYCIMAKHPLDTVWRKL